MVQLYGQNCSKFHSNTVVTIADGTAVYKVLWLKITLISEKIMNDLRNFEVVRFCIPVLSKAN